MPAALIAPIITWAGSAGITAAGVGATGAAVGAGVDVGDAIESEVVLIAAAAVGGDAAEAAPEGGLDHPRRVVPAVAGEAGVDVQVELHAGGAGGGVVRITQP